MVMEESKTRIRRKQATRLTPGKRFEKWFSKIKNFIFQNSKLQILKTHFLDFQKWKGAAINMRIPLAIHRNKQKQRVHSQAAETFGHFRDLQFESFVQSRWLVPCLKASRYRSAQSAACSSNPYDSFFSPQFNYIDEQSSRLVLACLSSMLRPMKKGRKRQRSDRSKILVAVSSSTAYACS